MAVAYPFYFCGHAFAVELPRGAAQHRRYHRVPKGKAQGIASVYGVIVLRCCIRGVGVSHEWHTVKWELSYGWRTVSAGIRT